MLPAPRRYPLLSLAGCRRIAIIGTTGSGKTTLSRRLARLLDAPALELDALFWGPNWTRVPADRFRAAVAAATRGDRWVTDGNYGKVRDLVWGRADTLIWLDYPLVVNFWRLTRRNLGRIVRSEELWHGNRESFRSQFLAHDSLYVWAAQTHRRHRREWRTLLADDTYAHLAIARFRSPGVTERWLGRVGLKA